MIVKAIVEAVLSVEDKVKEAMSDYMDIFVNECVVSAMHIKEHLPRFGLNSRDQECREEGMKVLSFKVWGGGGQQPVMEVRECGSQYFLTQ